MKYNRSLDGLRGIAILLVILFHFHFLLGLGWIGVQLFFVLSGYLITSNLMLLKEQPLGDYLKRFYWRRALRIVPLYYAYLLFVGIIFVVSGLPEDFMTMFPWLVTYTFNYYPLVHTYFVKDTFFMHLWSLSVEEQFYLVWPIIVFLLSRKNLQIALVVIIVGSPLVRYWMGEMLVANGFDAHYTGETVYRFSLSQWDGFAFGALIPIFSLNESKLPVTRLFLVVLLIAGALGAWNITGMRDAGLTPDISAAGYEIGNIFHFQHVWSYTVLNAFFLLFILVIFQLTRNRNIVVKLIFENAPIVYIGKISYGLYMLHFLIYMTFNKYSTRWFSSELVGFLIYMSICLAVATVSYYAFEKHFLLLKDKIFRSSKPVINEQN